MRRELKYIGCRQVTERRHYISSW